VIHKEISVIRYPSVFTYLPCREIWGRTRPSRTAREAYESVSGGFSIYPGSSHSCHCDISGFLMKMCIYGHSMEHYTQCLLSVPEMPASNSDITRKSYRSIRGRAW